jgi:hypothetical protein
LAAVDHACEGGAAPIALDIHFEDGGVMDEAVDGCQRHSLVWKYLAPFAERLVGGDQILILIVARLSP